MLLAVTFPQTPEQTLGTLVILGLIGAAIYQFCLAFASFSILGPIYCLLLFMNRARLSNPERPGEANESGA